MEEKRHCGIILFVKWFCLKIFALQPLIIKSGKHKLLQPLQISDVFYARSDQLHFHLNSKKGMSHITAEFKLEISNHMGSLIH